MKIYIDGDGCPVIDITIKIAKQYNLECIIITDTAHSFNKYDVKVIIVSKGADSVDFALVNKITSGDIVITQDYGLAAMCLAKKAIPHSDTILSCPVLFRPSPADCQAVLCTPRNDVQLRMSQDISTSNPQSFHRVVSFLTKWWENRQQNGKPLWLFL